MSVNSKMTSIADEIRELSGASGTMGLDAMASKLGEANTEVANQADLLAQAVAALEGKAAGGGSSGGASVETCTVTLRGVEYDTGYGILTGYSLNRYIDGAITTDYIVDSSFGSQGYTSTTGTIITDVICGSIITVISSKAMDIHSIGGYNSSGESDSSEVPAGAAILGTNSDMLIAFCKASTEANSHTMFNLCNSG